jgi:tetratricopeptide (TPR) repeat protein
MFLDKRVYQGSSGKVYPNAFTDCIADKSIGVTYQGVFLENDYISLMMLPEIGGRIHIGRDKTNGYDFFYRQTVIKPALVGLLGPWISGGVEFNWPQHHRPSTFMPVEYSIEEDEDGSRTVWLSEHEPMSRMKGMVGICLRPGASRIEARVRLYNRTPLVQTFLWWANVGVRVHEQYQSFFPPDVTYVADHAKRDISSFPVARNDYYGVDYRKGVDLTWYKNIPVPTSYMVTRSRFDFFGGYDHAKEAGFVHVANRFIAPGKKQWTWGNAEFGYAWDRELTDSDGPYIELMAGVYTDNQPDFSFLAPYETKSFSQYWYPIQSTRMPEPYWREALSRDPGDARSNVALGRSLLRRGYFPEAESHFRAAIERFTLLNPNPYDGEPYYSLGLALSYQDRNDEAYQWFYKATWNYAWQTAAFYEIAAIDCARGRHLQSLARLEASLERNSSHLKARNLKAAILRRLGRSLEAQSVVETTIKLDPLDLFSHNELSLLNRSGADQILRLFRGEPQTYLDVALDYAHAGLWQEASDLLSLYVLRHGKEKSVPMLWYAAGYFAERLSLPEQATDAYQRAKNASPDYCFPARLEELLLLEAALRRDPEDARAHYYLGNLLYDKKRAQEAIEHWEAAARIEPDFSISWRNLGIAYFNFQADADRAVESYEKARRAEPDNARLLYEFDQLRKRIGISPEERLLELERHSDLVSRRDDLTVEVATLYNETGEHEKALSVIEERRFHPWEGGEGAVSAQYVMAHLQLGRQAIDELNPGKALYHFESARNYPENLGEGKHLLTQEVHLDYFSGVALAQLGRNEEAQSLWRRAASSDQRVDMFAYFKGLALRSLGEEREALATFQELRQGAEELARREAVIDYFATSLPNFLLFDDDLQKRLQIEVFFLCGLALLGIGNASDALPNLEKVAHLDRNHQWARAELSRVRSSNKLRVVRP